MGTMLDDRTPSVCGSQAQPVVAARTTPCGEEGLRLYKRTRGVAHRHLFDSYFGEGKSLT